MKIFAYSMTKCCWACVIISSYKKVMFSKAVMFAKTHKLAEHFPSTRIAIIGIDYFAISRKKSHGAYNIIIFVVIV